MKVGQLKALAKAAGDRDVAGKCGIQDCDEKPVRRARMMIGTSGPPQLRWHPDPKVADGVHYTNDAMAADSTEGTHYVSVGLCQVHLPVGVPSNGPAGKPQ